MSDKSALALFKKAKAKLLGEFNAMKLALERKRKELVNEGIIIIGGGPKTRKAKPVKVAKKKRKMSKAGRARIAAAQKARWAKIKKEGGK